MMHELSGMATIVLAILCLAIIEDTHRNKDDE